MKLIWHTEQRKINDLIPTEKNPRKMTDKQERELRESLEKFNLVDIPAINTDNRIISGHQRLRILQLLGRGEEKVDVRVPNRELTEEEHNEYLLRANKNLGEWDLELLAGFDRDLLKNIGWDSDEIDSIFSEDIEDGFNLDEEVKKIKDPKTKEGEIFQLGNHKLICGNSTDQGIVDRLMNNETAKCVFTSPPYNINSGMYDDYKDNLESQEYIDFNIEVVENIKRHLKGFLFWNISYNKNARGEFIKIAHEIGNILHFKEMIVWNKKKAIPIRSKELLTRTYEPIFLYESEDSDNIDIINLYETSRGTLYNKRLNKIIRNYWELNVNNKTQLDNHKACYPVGLPAEGIKLTTEDNDIVIDPFGGSGTTMIACEELNRKCYMIELSPLYCDIIISRWEHLTGQKAKLIKE